MFQNMIRVRVLLVALLSFKVLIATGSG